MKSNLIVDVMLFVIFAYEAYMGIVKKKIGGRSNNDKYTEESEAKCAGILGICYGVYCVVMLPILASDLGVFGEGFPRLWVILAAGVILIAAITISSKKILVPNTSGSKKSNTDDEDEDF